MRLGWVKMAQIVDFWPVNHSVSETTEDRHIVTM